MSTAKYIGIHPDKIEVGMRLQITQTYPGAFTDVTEGMVMRINNQGITIGNGVDFVFRPFVHDTAKTTCHQVIELPETPGAVVLVFNDERFQSLTLTGVKTWVTYSGDIWLLDDVIAQLDRVLWDGVQ